MQDVVHKYLAVRGLDAHARDVSMDQGQPYTLRPCHQGNLWSSIIEKLLKTFLKLFRRWGVQKELMIVKNAVLLEESWWNLIFASFWLLDFKESHVY